MSEPLTDGCSDEIHQMLMAYYRDVYDYVSHRFPKRLQRYVEVSDVIQDVCIKAAEKFPTSRPSNPRAWLFAIANNILCDLVRRHRSLKRGAANVIGEESLNQTDVSTVVMLQDLVIYRRTPSNSAMRKELIIALEKALEAITFTQQEAVKLRYIEGLSSAQAASNLGISEPAFRKLASRALAAIRLELQSYTLAFHG